MGKAGSEKKESGCRSKKAEQRQEIILRKTGKSVFGPAKKVWKKLMK